MPMNGHDPSSQTVFSSRHSSLPGVSPMASTGLVSSRPPALRAASAESSAVRPDGLLDARSSFPETTSVSRGVSVDGKRSAERRWQDKAVLPDGPPASSQPGPDTKGARSSVSDTGSARSQNDSAAKER